MTEYATFITIPPPPSPLLLAAGTVYEPLIAFPAFVGFRLREYAPDMFVIEGFDPNGIISQVYRTRDYFEVTRRFAVLLGMTIDPDPEHLRTSAPAKDL